MTDVPDFRRSGTRLVDLIREDVSLRRDLSAQVLQAGDHVVLHTTDTEVAGYRANVGGGLAMPGLEPASARRRQVIEALVNDRKSPILDLGWRRSHGVYAIAVHRHGAALDLAESGLTLNRAGFAGGCLV